MDIHIKHFLGLDTRTKKEKEHWKCFDCSKDTLLNVKDYYMITNELWIKYGVENNMLCMNCIEKRLGHKLRKEDLTDCSLNYFNPYTLKILNK